MADRLAPEQFCSAKHSGALGSKERIPAKVPVTAPINAEVAGLILALRRAASRV
jgi:hypothetical protein